MQGRLSIWIQGKVLQDCCSYKYGVGIQLATEGKKDKDLTASIMAIKLNPKYVRSDVISRCFWISWVVVITISHCNW